MFSSSARSLRHTLGYWLYRHRKWGIVPLLAVGLLVHTHFMTVLSGNYMMIGGAIGILFGTLLRIVCFTFAGTKHPIHDPQQLPLITEGPYAVTRNPVYMAEAGIALGIAMMSRMPWFVLLTLICGGISTALVIEWEEGMLRHRYGAQFEQYRLAVPRWFSLRRLVHPESYSKTRGRVRLLTAVRAESLTMLIGLLSILAFLAKANLELYLWSF
jgi:protein-S-isoprenylcysteine O-methyltransferase Ste14